MGPPNGAAMGAAVLRPDGSATSDYTMADSRESSSGLALALSQLLAKPVGGAAALTAATRSGSSAIGDMVYSVEWRAYGVGLGPGALSMLLRQRPPLTELAIALPHARRRRILPPVAAWLLSGSRAGKPANAGAASPGSGLRNAASAALRLSGGVLALLQGVALNPERLPVADERLQLNLRRTAQVVAASCSGPSGTSQGLATAGAAAILKVCCAVPLHLKTASEGVDSSRWELQAARRLELSFMLACCIALNMAICTTSCFAGFWQVAAAEQQSLHWEAYAAEYATATQWHQADKDATQVSWRCMSFCHIPDSGTTASTALAAARLLALQGETAGIGIGCRSNPGILTSTSSIQRNQGNSMKSRIERCPCA